MKKTKASQSSLLEKGLKLSLINVWRNKFLSLATIFVMGTIIFIFNIILAINFMANDSLINLSKKVDMIAYLKESTTVSEAENLNSLISTMEGVEKVQYTSKDDALTRIKNTHPDISQAFEKYSLGNPLPASLNITTTHPSYHEKISNFLNKDQQKVYLSNIVAFEGSTNQAILASVTQNLLSVSTFAEQTLFWLILIFIIGGALIILNSIQVTIFHRKKEIGIMKLVGASHWYIKLPYILESIIYGIAAVALSFILFTFIAKKIEISTQTLYNYYIDINFYKIFLIELLITVALSIVSASVALQEYLRKDILES